ncbi:hypothetical protein NL676_024566 [Syzygium grande]|nr:hypothetical protein NL676_024566 [Syzygium grande]
MNRVDIDEEESLSSLANDCKVVEYLEPMMSRDLLHNLSSSFSFDSPQSSIWSLLLPCSHLPHRFRLLRHSKEALLWIRSTENDEEEGQSLDE